MARPTGEKTAKPKPDGAPPGAPVKAKSGKRGTGRVPLFVTGAATPDDLPPKLPASPPFVFATKWDLWQVVAGKLVPVLRAFRTKPGLNGTKIRKADGALNAKAYWTKKEEQGWKILKDVTLTEDGEPYLYEAAPGVWLSRWESAVGGSSIVLTDDAGFAAWAEWLVAEGHVAPIQPHVLEALYEEARKDAAMAADEAKHSEVGRDRLEKLSARFAAVEAAHTAPAAKAKPKAGRGGKAPPALVADGEPDDDDDDEASA